jgi:hypothetical protein
MDAKIKVPVEGGSEGDMLMLGTASWSKPGAEDRSLKYGWPDKNGKIARGGELPVWAIPQAVELAASSGYLSRSEMSRIAKSLIDSLAQA